MRISRIILWGIVALVVFAAVGFAALAWKPEIAAIAGFQASEEVVFVSYAPRFDAPRQLDRVPSLDEPRPVRGVTRLVPSFRVPASEVRKGA